jgi:PAS domain-containing protein
MQFDEAHAKPEHLKQFDEPGSKSKEPDSWEWFLDVPNIGFVVCDESLRYVKINDALARMNGVPAAEHLGKTVHEILGEAAAKVELAFHHVFATGQPLSTFELVAKLPARAEPARWIENLFPIKDAEGRVRQVGAISSAGSIGGV